MSTRRPDGGFSLLETLLALTITLVVMALVAQTMSHVSSVYRTQSEIAVSSGAAVLAFDDVLHELSRAGQGLGEGVPAILPRRPGSPVSADALTLRSNPEVAASLLRGSFEDASESVPADSPGAFDRGDHVIVSEAAGGGEAAEVVAVDGESLKLRSLESSDGRFRRRFEPARGARVLGAREVRYFLGETRADGRRELVKEVVGVGSRVLSRDVVSLSLEYLDPDDRPIGLGKVETSKELASVRVTLRFSPSDAALAPRTLRSRVALGPRSGTVDFERRDLGFRLARVFHPIDFPAGVASRPGSDFAVILASGKNPNRDPAYLYTFEMEKRFLSASVDDVVFLDDVRAPVALAFGPESGPFAGALFVAAWGLRIGHLARISPDEHGGLSRSSRVTTFEGTEAIAQAGGIAFGVDGALYVTSREKGAVYRFTFRGNGEPSRPERLFPLSGTPGTLVEGTDGHLYFLMNHEDRGSLWRMTFDETLSPGAPVLVGSLPGTAVSLSRDPVEGSLFALVRERTGDSIVVELDRGFLAGVAKAPALEALFSLRQWLSNLEEGKVDPREIPFPTQEIPEKLAALRVDELDFVSFDGLGSLYTGNREGSLVLKFELERPTGRFALGLAAGVIERGEDLPPEIRLHAWKKSAAGR
jgi:type II secretory pathway pseudopilin PulG